MRKLRTTAVLVLAMMIVCAACTKDPDNGDDSVVVPKGAINGLFTVNENGDKVYFSQGNLQYNKATNEWSFMEHQYDMLEVNAEDVGENCVSLNMISLFGWGTSGYDHGAVCYQPWSTDYQASRYYAYGKYNENLCDESGQADWGYNAIVNGGNVNNAWRTLTGVEWHYVFLTRSTASGIHFAKAKVNGVNGVLLLPDDWDKGYFTLNNTDTRSASFDSNVITLSQWTALEQHGVVFFPAAGYRCYSIGKISVCGVGELGHYWSSSYNNAIYTDYTSAFLLKFEDSGLNPLYNYNRNHGRSVRLVCDAK